MRSSSEKFTVLANLVVLMLAGLSVSGGPKAELLKNPYICLPESSAAPVIDGRIEPEEWKDAFRTCNFISTDTRTAEPRSAVLWMTHHKQRFFVALKSELPPGGKPLSRVRRNGDRIAALDDAIEVLLAPHENNPAISKTYQFICNAIGTSTLNMYDLQIGSVKYLWRQKGIEFDSKIQNGFWTFEMALDSTDMDTKIKPGEYWKLNVCRDWKRPWQFTGWSSAQVFRSPPQMGTVLFSRNTPVLRLMEWGKVDKNIISPRIEARALSEKFNSVSISEKIYRKEKKIFEDSRKLRLEKNNTSKFSFAERECAPGDTIEIEIRDGNTGDIYFYQPFRLPFEPRKKWDMDSAASKLALFFYPSFNRLKLSLDLDGKLIKAKPHNALITVRNEASGKNIMKLSVPLETHAEIFKKVLDFKKLEPGIYKVKLDLLSEENENEVIKSFTAKFEKKVWPWEGNKIGVTDEVLPPWTPIKVNGKKLSCWGRDYILNKEAFFNQVTDQGKEILAGPIRLIAKVNGKNIEWKSGNVDFKKKTPGLLLFGSRLKSGKLCLNNECRFEYDGLAKYTIGIPELGDAEIENLTLDIPVKQKYAKLLHACSDSARANSAGAIPEGKGLVWSSKKAENRSIIGNFIPYVWLGDRDIGFCWIANWDKDWVIDKDKACIEIVRKDDSVHLRVNMIQKPVKLDRKREIVFGLMATPVKPRPKDWRTWYMGFGSLFGFKGKAFRLFGSTARWGAESPWGDVYPKNRDWNIVREEVEKEKKKGFDKVILYTNTKAARTGMPEMQSFKWEWACEPYADATWSGCSMAVINLSDSFIDFALSNFEKMLSKGKVDGIYFDNTMAMPDTNIPAGRGYKLEDGRVQAWTDVWMLRKYLKRVAALFHKYGKEPLIMVHMTNSSIIPAHSFATMQLDWEMGYEISDKFDAFPLDFIQAESTGRQSGLVPFVLSGMVDPDARGDGMNWKYTRALLALTLLHDIKAAMPGMGNRAEMKMMMEAMDKAGAYSESAEFIPYWTLEEKIKSKPEGLKISLIKLEKGLLAVCVNTEKEGKVFEFEIDDSVDGFKKSSRAFDIQRANEIIPKNKDGFFRMFIPGHDFRLIYMAPRPPHSIAQKTMPVASGMY